jgi:uncharacterized protein
MPEVRKHVDTSIKRTGKEYREVHEWIDDPATKKERHDVTRMLEFGSMFRERYGEESVQEYVAHLHDDLKGKFGHLVEDAAKAGEKPVDRQMQSLQQQIGQATFEKHGGAIKTALQNGVSGLIAELERMTHETLQYFGVKNSSTDAFGVRDADVEVLRKAGVVEEDILHCRKVAHKAVEIARRTGQKLDMDLVVRGALFHDLGKSKTHAIEHGKIGAELGKGLALPTAITDIMEKHIRGGLTESEALELGLPVKDYRLKSLEERIIIYADRLVDIITDCVVEKDSQAEERFEEILTRNIKYGKNDLTLRRYLGYHSEIQALMGKAHP